MGDENFTAGLLGSFAKTLQQQQRFNTEQMFEQEALKLKQQEFKLKEKASQLQNQILQDKVKSGELFRNLAQALMGPQPQPAQPGPGIPSPQGPQAPQGGLQQSMIGQPQSGGIQLEGVNVGPGGPSFSFGRQEPELPPGTSQETAMMLRQMGLDPTNPASYTPENLKEAQKKLTELRRSRQIPSIGSIPPGFELKVDEKTNAVRLEPIAGGPAQQEKQVAQEARATISGFTVRDTREARQLLAERPNVAARLTEQFIPGTPSFSLAQRIESLKSTIAIDQLLSIKRQGSGLGQVPQQQLELLSRLMGDLSLGLPTEELDQLLKDIEDTYLEVLDRMSEEDLNRIGVAKREQTKKRSKPGQGNQKVITFDEYINQQGTK